MAYGRLGKYDYAARDFTEVIVIMPRNAEAYGQRGLIRLRQGRDQEAEADFKTAYQLDAKLKQKLQPLIDEAKRKTTVKP